MAPKRRAKKGSKKVKKQEQPSEDESKYYYIDAKQSYETLAPSLRSDVIRLYGLLDIADSVARVNTEGTKGVRLRKSYKSHIADLPGKYTIPKDRTLSPVICAPDNPDMIRPEMKQFDVEELKRLFNFQKSSINGIPGFDANQLGIGSNGSRKRKMEDGEGNAKRRFKVRFD